MSLDIAAVQSALENWVQSVLTLPETNLLWAHQDAPEPSAGTWASMNLSELNPVGPVDSTRAEWAEDPEPGEEVRLVTEGYRSLTFGVQVFSREKVVGNQSAVALLGKLLNHASLESARLAFRAAGLALYRRGGVQNLAALNAERFEGRALLELFFYAVDGAEERTGYIATARGALTLEPDAAEDIPVPVEVLVPVTPPSP